MVLQLYPEPPKPDQNKFFRDGTRMVLVTIILVVVLTCPEEKRNLATVYEALNNEDMLNDLLMKAAKSRLLGGEIARNNKLSPGYIQGQNGNQNLPQGPKKIP